MARIIKFLLPATFLLFFIVNALTLNDGHSWGDDFAQYIQHAINLVEHKPYTSNIALDLWTVVPPGFPLLLSSFIYWFGVNLKLLKIINLILWALAALVAYNLAVKKLNIFWARIITIWFLTLPFFFFFKQNVLSDIPFLCFVLLSIWTFLQYEEREEKSFFILSLACMCYAFLIRFAGIALFLSVVLYFCAVKRDWKKSLPYILAGVLTWTIELNFKASVTEYVTQVAASPGVWLWAVWNNVVYVLKSILDLFIWEDSFLAKMISPAGILIFKIVGPVVIVGLIVVFLYRLCHKQASFLGCFTFLYFLGVLFWPVQGGSRYILPIMIPITVYLVQFIKPAWRNIAMLVFVFLILHNILVIGSNFNFNDDNIEQPESLEMMHWVAQNIRPEEHYMFYKPRALGLMTQRIGAAFWIHPRDRKEWYRRIGPLQIRYLITDKQLDQISKYDELDLPIDNYSLHLSKVWENSRFKILRVRHSL